MDVHESQDVGQVFEAPKISSQDRNLQCTVGQILDVLVLEKAERLAEVPKIVSQDGIQQRTVEQTVDILVPQDMEEPAEFFKAFSQDRVQLCFGGQIIEPPVISLAEKIVEVPVIQTEEKTQQDVNMCVQHLVNAVEVEKRIIQEKINQVIRHAETLLLQIVKKTVEVPEIQTVPAEIPELQFTDKVVDIPVVAQRQIRMNQEVQKTIEIPQLQDADKVVDVPVLSVVRAPLVQVMAKTVQTPQLLLLEKIVVIPGIQTVHGPQTSESLNGEISKFQLELQMGTMCADEQDVFIKVNADLEQVACETCVKDNTAMVAKVGDLSSTSGSMHQQRTSGQAGKEEREKKKMEGREGKEKGKVRGEEKESP